MNFLSAICLLFQKSFEQLTHLDLFNNDICNIEEYRTKVFKLLPNLKFLDDADADDNDEEESDDEGANGAEEGDEDDGEGENSKIHHRFHEKDCFIITFNFFYR